MNITTKAYRVVLVVNHLYLLSNEKKIKEGDWCIKNAHFRQLLFASDRGNAFPLDWEKVNDNFLKVIASTNLAIDVPRFPASFTKNYNGSNKIIVECSLDEILCTNEYNEIIIHPS